MSRSHGVYLSFQPPSGERLLCHVEPGRFFLPATAPMEEVVVSDDSASGISINIDAVTQNATITATDDHCTILGNNNFRYTLPASSSSHTYVVVLRESDNILAPTGRWELLWDDEHGSIHNSMRPPPLPIPTIPSDALEPLRHDGMPIDETTTPKSPSTPATDNDSAIADVATPQEVETDDDQEEDKEIAETQWIDSIPRPSTPAPGAWPAVNTANARLTEAASPIPTSSNERPATDLLANIGITNAPSKTANEEGHDGAESSSVSGEADCDSAEKGTEDSTKTTRTSESRIDELLEKEEEESSALAPDPAEKTTPNAEPAGEVPFEFSSSSMTSTKNKGKRWNIIPTQKVTPSPKASRKRSSEANSGGSGGKRIRSSQSLNADASGNEKGDGKNAGDEIVVVIPRRSPSEVTSSKSAEKRTKSSSTSPANKTVRQKTKEDEWAPKVYMAGNTKIDQGHKKIMRSFHELGGTLTKNVIEADVLCVSKDELLVKSGSLLLAIATGISIVTEDWLIEATRRSVFPDPARYLPRDPERERLWGFKLADAVSKGRKGLTHLLANKEVYFTKSLHDSVTAKVAHELSKLATALGADYVKQCYPTKKSLKDADDLRKFVIIGAEGAEDLHNLAAKGLTVYSKELLTTAVLRGKLERRAFTIAAAVKDESD